MKKKTILSILIAIALITSNLSAVFADDGAGTEPVLEPQAADMVEAQEQAQESFVEEEPQAELLPADESAGADPSEEAAVEETEGLEETEPEAEVVTDPDVVAESAETDESLTELVEVLNEENVEVISDTGESLPLASQEAAEILASTDPFFWNGTAWVGYTQTGTGCPANVTCFASATPFQEAVTQAGANNTVYVASGNYAEDVIINNANQSLVAFQSITVPDAAAPTISLDSSGYAVVRSITLNVDLTLNDGVYADLVTVNEPGQTGGRLDDAMELVNDGGRIEADVVIYGADGHYRVRDKNHSDVNFEWECAEPNEVIYPGRTYRMTLMNPNDQTIIDYFETHGDERNTAPWNLDLTAIERLEDLQIAVNVSEDFGNWSHLNEERIYWYLLGNTGSSTTAANINLNPAQQTLADEITDGTWDDVTRYWGIWFMYPTLESGSTQVSPSDRQLTFLVYDPRPVFGCVDPLALNYDPNADTDDESCVYYEGCTDPDALNYDPEAIVDDETCRYTTTTDTPPQFFPNPLPIPVTGEEELLIPVTGVDATEQGKDTIQLAIAVSSLLIVSAGVILFGKKNELER
jgi:hypothetical protein